MPGPRVSGPGISVRGYGARDGSAKTRSPEWAPSDAGWRLHQCVPARSVTPVTVVTATLIVGDFESRCGNCNCNQPTYLHDVNRHTDISGRLPQQGGGCGARFVNIASLYQTVSTASRRELRPDLPVRAQSTDS